MLMKKFVAPTSREAMQKMKNELGPDALVISNRKVAGGVEILAMAEHAVDTLSRQADQPVAAPAPQAPAPRAAAPMERAPASAPRPVAPAATPFAQFASAQARTAAPVAPLAAPQPAPRGAQPPAPRDAQQFAPLRAPSGSASPAVQSARPFTTLKDFAARVEATPQVQAPAPQAQTPRAFAQPAPAVNPFAAPAARRRARPAALVSRPARAQAQPAPAAPIVAKAPAAPAAPVALAAPAPRAAAPAPVAARVAAPVAQPADSPVHLGNSQTEERLFGEVKAMKAMLQNQLAGLAFRDLSQRRPLALKFWRELSDAGFSATVTRTVVDKLPDDLNEAQARKWLADVLERNLHCADSAHDLVEAGGIYALVGPTGVGKTTTVAKLAARCVVKYGAQSLGLITTDSYRIGAFDQLAIYGKILGVKVHSAQSYSELEATLSTLRGKRLVLIDTTGMGQRDSRLAEQINLLDSPQIRRVLLLNAAAQAETLDEVALAYQGRAAGARPLTGVIFSKIDEAAKLGPVMDAAIRHTLDVYYVANGQRVPEDLHPAKAQVLIHRALKSAADPVFALREDELPLRAMAANSAASTFHA
jgi:flagellar biosynthesis protein FlhF